MSCEVKIIAFLLCCLLNWSNASEGKVIAKEKPIEIGAWIEKFVGSDASGKRFPFKILVAGEYRQSKDWVNYLTVQDFDDKMCEVVSYLRCVNARDFAYALQINKFDKIPSYDELMEMTESDGLVVFNSGNTLIAPYGSKQRIAITQEGVITAKTDIRQMLSRLFKSLGYGAVVLDIRGRHILIGGVDLTIESRASRALLIEGSENLYELRSVNREPRTIQIHIESTFGAYAVGVLPDNIDEARVARGQKIAFEP